MKDKVLKKKRRTEEKKKRRKEENRNMLIFVSDEMITHGPIKENIKFCSLFAAV
jgi:hypothetical protein